MVNKMFVFISYFGAYDVPTSRDRDQYLAIGPARNMCSQNGDSGSARQMTSVTYLKMELSVTL